MSLGPGHSEKQSGPQDRTYCPWDVAPYRVAGTPPSHPPHATLIARGSVAYFLKAAISPETRAPDD